MYNEPFEQLMQTLAGVYRSYYELVEIDESFVDRVHVVIVADGYDKLDEVFLMKCEKAGIYNEFKTKRWRTVETPPGRDHPIHVFKKLNFINERSMNDKKRIYGTNNIIHTFSRKVKYSEFMNAFTPEEQFALEIDGYELNDFLVGDSRMGRVKQKRFYHIPLNLHFAIKHRNQGKIESHKWFFKGF
jgi:cellulose synthase/poly-beta-1,6-N-acetylglucosamine synthase-like glycosyltransferase